MEGDEVGISSKIPNWKLLFLLRTKIKRNADCPNKDIFKHIHQNIRAHPKSKKSALINDCGNTVAYSEQSKQSEGVGEQVRFVLNLLWRSVGWCHPRKCGCFYSHLIRSETVFRAGKLIQNCYKHMFFWKTGNLILVNWEQFRSTT